MCYDLINGRGKKIYARRKRKTSKRRPEEIKLIKLMKFIITVRITCNIKKVEVTFSRYRPGVAQRVGAGIALLFNDRGTRRG